MKPESTFSWWRQLAPRERRLIAWGGAGLLIALGYAYLWLPMAKEREKLRETLPQLRSDARHMQIEENEAIRLRAARATPPSGAAMLAAIRQEANQAGIDGRSLQINMLDEHRANISLTGVSFDSWMALVTQLQKTQRIGLASCGLEARPETGMVGVHGVFEAGK